MFTDHDHWLFGYFLAEGVEPILWATRMRIAVDVAQGLSFLHSKEPSIIYRDLKASNILLDSVCQVHKNKSIKKCLYSYILLMILLSFKICRNLMQDFRILG